MEINRCLILDTETDGLEETAKVIEVGAILYSLEHGTLQELSTLLPAETNAAEAVNRIRPGALRDVGFCGSSFALETLFAMSKHADVYVAHNAEFDRVRVFGNTDFLPMASLPWVDSMEMPWPLASKQQGSLINLALDHGIGVASAHRALTDCRLIASLFDRMTNLQSMFQVAMRPKGLYVGMQPFADNHLAREAGFKWDRLVPKKWSRRMAIEDAETLNFPVRRVTENVNEESRVA